MTEERTRAETTAALVDALFNFMPRVANHVTDRLQKQGLSATDYWALQNIEGPTPMKDLARCMDYDPSYVTVVADHLENVGLIERQQDETDRRIKNLVLTAKGRRLKQSAPELLWQDPNLFSGLNTEERAQLAGLIAKLTSQISEPPHPDS